MQYKKAVELVADLFRDVQREVTGLPYIVHLVGVSYLVSKITDDEDVIIAALLHDILEDVPSDRYSERQMRDDFGDKVTNIVKTVSHNDAKYGKQESRQRYLDQIKSGSIEACMVSTADLLHNATDVAYIYQNNPEGIKAKFGGKNVELRAWFWHERLNILSDRLGSDNLLIRQLQDKMTELDKVHAEIS